MIHITESVFVARSAEEAFETIVHMAESGWQSDAVSAVEVGSGSLGVGTRFAEKFEVLGEILEAQCEVVAFEPGRRLAWKGAAPGLDYQAEFRFEPEADGSRLTYSGTSALGDHWQPRAEEYEREWRVKNREELQQIKAMLEGQAMEEV